MTGPSPATIRTALDAILLDSLRPGTLGLAMLFTAIALTKPLFLPQTTPAPGAGTVVGLAAWEAFMAIMFGLMYVWLRGERSPEFAHPLAFGIVLLVLTDGVLHMGLLPNPLETFTFILLILGISFFFTSRPWFITAVVTVAIGWVLSALFAPAASWVTWETLGMFMVESLVLGGIVHVARGSHLRNLVTAQHENARRWTELQDAFHLVETQRDRLDGLTRDLRRANKELESFAYTVSHDIRAPLRRIDILAQALQEDTDGGDPPAIAQDVARIRTESRHASRLANDLLQLAQVSRGELRRETIDVTAMARQSIGQLQRQDPLREVDVRIQEGLEAFADPNLLRAVFDNLLENAWKYTSKMPKAHIEVAAEGDHGFVVRDSGIGFSSAESHRLFEPFSRLASAATFEGTGVGLATVKRIIERHGGTIRADGEPGKGAAFHLTLPPPDAANGSVEPI